MSQTWLSLAVLIPTGFQCHWLVQLLELIHSLWTDQLLHLDCLQVMRLSF